MTRWGHALHASSVVWPARWPTCRLGGSDDNAMKLYYREKNTERQDIDRIIQDTEAQLQQAREAIIDVLRLTIYMGKK